MTAQTISCIWWKSISGSTARDASAPNRTLAIGSPAARDFFDPANWMATRSARSKRSALAPYQVSSSITASSTASTASSPASRTGLTWCQTPSTTPSLNAV